MKTYNAETPIRFNGKRYEIGSQIELEDKDAKPLLISKSISGGKEATPTAPVGPTDPAERAAAITAAIGKLDKENPELWTKAGVPNTTAIQAITGWPVTAAERNEAWEKLSK